MRMRSAENADDVKYAPDPTNAEQDLFAAVTKPLELQNWEVADSYTIRRGNYDIDKIIKLITNSFNKIYANKTIGLKIDLHEYRVKINPNIPVAIACYAENFVLQLLGFGSQSTQLDIQGKRSIEFMIIPQFRTIQADLPPSLKQITNMYVYSDIVELSLMGNSQLPFMGFLQIKSRFQDNGHWVFNPLLYVRVREKNIYTITMTILTETGDEFPIQDGLVNCRLNFRSRPFRLKAI